MRSRGSCALIWTVVAALVLAVAGSQPSNAAAGHAGALARFAAAADPAWSPDGRRIAFVEQHGAFARGMATLYVMNADGSAARRVISRKFDARWPSWSPDGRRIVFEHRAPKPEDSEWSDIYVVNVDGSGLRRLVSGGSDPAWGPGGKRIAFAGDRFRILTVAPAGGDVRVVADPGPETGGEGSCKSNGYWQPTWSPDGEFVAFAISAGAAGECGFDVSIGVSRGLGAKVRILADGWYDEPDWSPDGKRLALVHNLPVDLGSCCRIGVRDLRTRKTRYLRTGLHPRWSPDGRRLVFVRGNPQYERPRSQIYVMDADGSHLRQLTR